MRMYQHKGPSPLYLFMLGFTILTLVGLTTTAAVSKDYELTHRHKRDGALTVHFDMQKRREIYKRIKHEEPARRLLLGHNGLTGYENATYITRGNKTCLKISCTEDHYVRSCDKDGGNDTCVRCAAGTFLADNTSSILHNHECVTTPACFPEAVKSRSPNYCGDHRTFCKCDISRNFCGVDPCRCKVGHCTSISAPVLNINCGCDRLPTTTKTPHMPTRPTYTKIETTMKATTTTTTTTESTTPSTTPSTTTVSSTVPYTKTITQTPSVQLPCEEDGFSSGNMTGMFFGGLIVGIIICGIILLIYRKCSLQ
ncbi:uncharacterized protein [Argopecten irradians]|uniref:uncharacterized protein isoform X2 n=1 Tax=Argopecten irradians TaxID=31199 RepID=UPI0037211D94